MADLVTPAVLPVIPPDVTALLAAVRDALDIPMSHWDDADERAHHRILNERAGVALVALEGILDKGHDIPASTDWLIRHAAESPVTYTVWVPEQSDGGAE